jgi:group I intron endonuclease
MSIGIYKITNPKGQVYIGQSINIERRWKDYKRLAKRSAGRKILNSLKGYGVENHSFEIIEECLREQLHEKEYYWKKYYTSVENGLNCDYFDSSGGPRSEETKRRISEGAKGKKRSEETKQKLRKPKTEEHKQNISKAKQNISQETRQKISEGKRGKTPNRDYKVWAKQQQKPVLQYDLEGNFIKEWEGVKIAAKYLGCDPTTITANLRGITKKGFGYIWKRKIT